jgi:hypothetical protein
MARKTAITPYILSIRAAAKTTIFFLKCLPMLPSRPVDWVTAAPVITRVELPAQQGQIQADLYRPAHGSPHPGVAVCLGVVPDGYDHPQIPRLGAALARAGLAALIYRSTVMGDLRLDPRDIGDLALAYQWLIEQPYVDPARSGLIGTCVGGSFALMAAASPHIRDRVAFVGALAPYASMTTLARDVACSSRSIGPVREYWPVDRLTRTVFVRSLTAQLEPHEAKLLRNAFAAQDGYPDVQDLSPDGRAVYAALTAHQVEEAEAALQRLPAGLQERLAAMSPINYLRDIHAPLIMLGHDRNDLVIPVSESRCLWSALSGRRGVQYTEFNMFEHMDPTKRKLSPLRQARELAKFYRFAYPVFRQAMAG